MKKYKEKSEVRQILETTKCDICGAETKGNNWAKESFDLSLITIKKNEGVSFPEYSAGETCVFDICPNCWEEKLIPFMQTFGAEPCVVEYDN